MDSLPSPGYMRSIAAGWVLRSLPRHLSSLLQGFYSCPWGRLCRTATLDFSEFVSGEAWSPRRASAHVARSIRSHQALQAAKGLSGFAAGQGLEGSLPRSSPVIKALPLSERSSPSANAKKRGPQAWDRHRRNGALTREFLTACLISAIDCLKPHCLWRLCSRVRERVSRWVWLRARVANVVSCFLAG